MLPFSGAMVTEDSVHTPSYAWVLSAQLVIELREAPTKCALAPIIPVAPVVGPDPSAQSTQHATVFHPNVPRQQGQAEQEPTLSLLTPQTKHPVAWLAVSTAGDLLGREGLVKKRRRRRPHQHPGVVPSTPRRPAIFGPPTSKGCSGTGDGIWCYALTLADQHARYLLACQGLRSIKGRGPTALTDECCRPDQP